MNNNKTVHVPGGPAVVFGRKNTAFIKNKAGAGTSNAPGVSTISDDDTSYIDDMMQEDLDDIMNDAALEIESLNYSIGEQKLALRRKKNKYDEIKDRGDDIQYIAESIYQDKCVTWENEDKVDAIRDESSKAAKESGIRFMNTLDKVNINQLPDNIHDATDFNQSQIVFSSSDINTLINGTPAKRKNWEKALVEGKANEFTEHAEKRHLIAKRWRMETIRRLDDKIDDEIMAAPKRMMDTDDMGAALRADAFVSRDGVKPDGVIHATAVIINESDMVDKDGNPQDTYWNACPEGTKLQALRSAYKLGLDRAIVAATINEKDVVHYEFNVNEPVNDKGQTIADIDKDLKETHKRLISDKNEYDKNKSKADTPETKAKPRNFTIYLDKGKEKTHVDNFAAFSGLKRSEAEKVFKNTMIGLEGNDKVNGPKRKERLRELYKQYDPRTSGREIIYLDYETTGFSPKEGDQVVESGFISISPRGKETVEHSYHRLDQRDFNRNGTSKAPTKVHNVEGSDLKHQRRFKDSGVATKLREKISKGAIVISHNSTFESEFSNAAGVTIPKEQIFDTSYASRFLDERRDTMTGGADNMSDYASRYGVENPDAHTSIGDARTMRSAFNRMMDSWKN